MSLHYNLSPLEAIKFFYGTETNGVWIGDIIKNEKKRNINLSSMHREYLLNYGFFPINKGEMCLFHPDSIRLFSHGNYRLEDSIYWIGNSENYLVGVRADQISDDDPELFLGEVQEDNSVYWEAISDRLSDFLKNQFLRFLLLQNGVQLLEQPADIEACFGEYHVAVFDIKSRKPYTIHQDLSLCWDEDQQMYLAVMFEYDGTLSRVFKIPLGVSDNKKHGKFTIEELRELFNKEFYENSLHCDFSHALKLQEEIIARQEQAEDQKSLELGQDYQCAGRCCWKLKQWEAAEQWYQKAIPLFQENEESNPDEVSSFYLGLGGFYHDMGNQQKSEDAFETAFDISQKYQPENHYRIGQLLQTQAQKLSEEDAFLDKALDLYNQALEEYQKDPKNCKYDIARCQQLRGEVRRRKKQLNKSSN